MKAWLKFGVILLVTAFLTRFVPFSDFFRNVDTLVHELSHAVVTLLLSGDVRVIYLFADQSGVTYAAYSSAWKAIPISLAGYIGSALFSVLLFKLYAARKERTGLLIVAILAALGLILFVRNGYGMLWCGGYAALTFVIYMIAPPWLQKGYYLLIAFICLVESALSPLILIWLSLVDPSSAGDAAGLRGVTYVPAFVWSLVFMAVSLLCAKKSVQLFGKRGFGSANQAGL